MILKIVKKLVIPVSLLAVTFFVYALFRFNQGKDIFSDNMNYADHTPVKLIVSFLNEGKSMEPTLYDGDVLSYNISLKPEIGNIVAFDCFTPKCINGKTPNKVKRLIKINEQGCYWFEGDNKDFSWDSRNYGYLCPPDDVKILGVVIQ